MYETRNETAAKAGPSHGRAWLDPPGTDPATRVCQPGFMPAPRFGVTDRPGDIVDRSGQWLAEQLGWRWVKSRREIEVRAGRQVRQAVRTPADRRAQ